MVEGWLFRLSACLGLFTLGQTAPRRLLSASLSSLYIAAGLSCVYRLGRDPRDPDFYNTALYLADLSSRTLMFPLTFSWALAKAPLLHLAVDRLNSAGHIINQMGLTELKYSSPLWWVSWPLVVEMTRLLVCQPSSSLDVHFRLFHAATLVCMSLTAGQLDLLLDLASRRAILLTASLGPDQDRLLSAIRAMDHIERSVFSLNQAYSLHLLLFTVIPYQVGIACAFDLIDLLLDGDYSWLPVQGFILNLTSTVFCWSIIWNICSACASLSLNIKKFTIALYQLMMDDNGKRFLNNAKLRLYIAKKREIVFTACGFFNLDFALIHSIIASATTYLVILVQFGQPLQYSKPTRMSLLNTTSYNYNSSQVVIHNTDK